MSDENNVGVAHSSGYSGLLYSNMSKNSMVKGTFDLFLYSHSLKIAKDSNLLQFT